MERKKQEEELAQINETDLIFERPTPPENLDTANEIPDAA